MDSVFKQAKLRIVSIIKGKKVSLWAVWEHQQFLLWFVVCVCIAVDQCGR